MGVYKNPEDAWIYICENCFDEFSETIYDDMKIMDMFNRPSKWVQGLDLKCGVCKSSDCHNRVSQYESNTDYLNGLTRNPLGQSKPAIEMIVEIIGHLRLLKRTNKIKSIIS